MPSASSVNPHQGKGPKQPRIHSSCGENCCKYSKEMSSGGECQSSGSIDDVGVHVVFEPQIVNRNMFSLPIFSSTHQRQRSNQDLKSARQISNLLDSDSNCAFIFSSKISSPQRIWMVKSSLSEAEEAQRSSLPLSPTNTRGIESIIYGNPGLKISHNLNVPDSETSSTLIFGSTLRFQFSLCRASLGLSSHTLLRSFLSAIQFPSTRRNSITFQPLLSSTSSEDNQLQNQDQTNLIIRQILMESALYLYRLADSLLEGSASLMVVTTANNGLDFRIVMEDFQAQNQSPLYSMNEMHIHSYGDMWPDVDRMSYEELLALEDRIGYVSTGLSEEVAHSLLKHSKYFLFAEENAPKKFCSICQENYEEQDELGTLDCSHRFHIACIKQWLGYKNICPICKSTGLYNAGPSFPIESNL